MNLPPFFTDLAKKTDYILERKPVISYLKAKDGSHVAGITPSADRNKRYQDMAWTVLDQRHALITVTNQITDKYIGLARVLTTFFDAAAKSLPPKGRGKPR